MALDWPDGEYDRRRHAAMSTEQHEEQMEWRCASNDNQCSEIEREEA